jgi:hypothetical protein
MSPHLREAQQGVQFLPLGAAIGGQQALLQRRVGVRIGGRVVRHGRQLLNDGHRQLAQHLIVFVFWFHNLGVLKLRLHTLKPGLRLLNHEVREAAVGLQAGRGGN